MSHLSIRAARWPQDLGLLPTLDTEISSQSFYRPVLEPLAFRLVEEPLTPTLRKTYPLDPEDRNQWDWTALAEYDGHIAGFAAAQHSRWNRRVTLWHLYVDGKLRGQGIGSRLLSSLVDWARSLKARCIWLETQNNNVPAIRFYQRSGFEFCGFDSTLYDAESEVALFFARQLAT